MPSTKLRQSDIDRLFDGAIEPCDQAYVDVFLDPDVGIDLNHISISSYQDSIYSEAKKENTVTFTHELLYKGNAVWRLETNSHNVDDNTGGYCSTCAMSTSRLAVTIERKGKKWFGDKRKFSERKLYDIAALIRGSAVAYQMIAAEEEINMQYEVLNNDILPKESFSSYVVEISDESGESGSDEDSDASSNSDANSKEEGENSDSDESSDAGTVASKKTSEEIKTENNILTPTIFKTPSDGNDGASSGDASSIFLGFNDMIRLFS
jgi:hypothetical protein